MLSNYYRRLLASALRDMGAPGGYRKNGWTLYLQLSNDAYRMGRSN